MINPKEIKNQFIEELLGRNIKKVLDLGCGEMLLSKRFLEKGALVKGIDIREPSIIPEGAIFVKGNILKELFEKNCDLVISSLILHFFQKEYALEVLKKMKDSTILGGYNFLILMSKDDSLYNQEKFFPSLEEIKDIYSNWDLIKNLEDETELEEHSGLPKHSHRLIFLIFKKN
jgi:SAM-dependent methyltransferase